MSESDILFNSEVIRNTSLNFQRYFPGTLISLAVENYSRLLILSRVLIPEKLEGAFQTGNRDSVILLNGHRLNQEVFINIE